jgi:hypothetical protein
LWFAIEGPLPSTRAQSLTIGTMARKGKAFFSKTTICSSLWFAIGEEREGSFQQNY